MLRYAQGILKGRPLARGGSYTVTKYRGEPVAQFPNGALARFYDDGISEPATAEEKPAPTIAEVAAAVENPDPELVISAPPEAFHPLPPAPAAQPQKKLRVEFSFNHIRPCYVWPAMVVDGPLLEFSWLMWSVNFEIYWSPRRDP
jgi:hypothetical protein